MVNISEWFAITGADGLRPTAETVGAARQQRARLTFARP